MKNPTGYIRSNAPSSFWVSRNYGKTFTEISKNFTLPNGTRAVITEFYSSKANNEHYILVDKFHKYIYSSSDECRTFRRVKVYFHPVEIKYHPYYDSYVLAYEKDMGNKQVLNFVIVVVVGHLLMFAKNFEDEWLGRCHVLNQISNSIPVIWCMGAFFRGTFSESK